MLIVNNTPIRFKKFVLCFTISLKSFLIIILIKLIDYYYLFIDIGNNTNILIVTAQN
jgi:hypothetical protein